MFDYRIKDKNGNLRPYFLFLTPAPPNTTVEMSWFYLYYYNIKFSLD